MNFAKYQMSYKTAAGKAFSAPMPICIASSGLSGLEAIFYLQIPIFMTL
jgi:hypothetical protein